MLQHFRAALAFFTRLPVGSAPLPPTLNGLLAYFPAVGLVLGALVACVLWVGMQLLPPLPCGVLACLAWVALTGGLHLDGVADCGDGLLVEAPPARRLEIMKDSRLGTFGGIALFLVLALKTSALAALAQHLAETPHSFWPLLAACGMAAVVARSLTFLGLRLPCARPGGLGSAMYHGITGRHGLLALLLALVMSLCNGWQGLLALLAALLVALLLLRAARRRIGGMTGDVFGCLVEVAEATVLLVCCA